MLQRSFLRIWLPTKFLEKGGLLQNFLQTTFVGLTTTARDVPTRLTATVCASRLNSNSDEIRGRTDRQAMIKTTPARPVDQRSHEGGKRVGSGFDPKKRLCGRKRGAESLVELLTCYNAHFLTHTRGVGEHHVTFGCDQLKPPHPHLMG